MIWNIQPQCFQLRWVARKRVAQLGVNFIHLHCPWYGYFLSGPGVSENLIGRDANPQVAIFNASRNAVFDDALFQLHWSLHHRRHLIGHGRGNRRRLGNGRGDRAFHRGNNLGRLVPGQFLGLEHRRWHRWLAGLHHRNDRLGLGHQLRLV